VSFRVLVVPEDRTWDHYILKPLVERMLKACGKPKAYVEVIPEPKVQGYDQAKALLAAQETLDLYRRWDLWLFLPDADGKERGDEFGTLEKAAAEKGVTLLCCAAVQEVEVWLLAGHVKRLKTSWADVRQAVSVKENVFAGFLEQFGDACRASQGRDLLMKETLGKYDGLLKRCPELKELEQRIRDVLRKD
jgi:hypothetical protein